MINTQATAANTHDRSERNTSTTAELTPQVSASSIDTEVFPSPTAHDSNNIQFSNQTAQLPFCKEKGMGVFA